MSTLLSVSTRERSPFEWVSVPRVSAEPNSHNMEHDARSATVRPVDEKIPAFWDCGYHFVLHDGNGVWAVVEDHAGLGHEVCIRLYEEVHRQWHRRHMTHITMNGRLPKGAVTREYHVYVNNVHVGLLGETGIFEPLSGVTVVWSTES